MADGMVSGVSIDLDREKILLVPNLVPTKPQGYWGLPGGRVEDEGILHAILREWTEETGLCVPFLEKENCIELDRSGSNGSYKHYFFCISAEQNVGELKSNGTDNEVGPPQWIPLSDITKRKIKVFYSHLQGIIAILEKIAVKNQNAAFLAMDLARLIENR